MLGLIQQYIVFLSLVETIWKEVDEKLPCGVSVVVAKKKEFQIYVTFEF